MQISELFKQYQQIVRAGLTGVMFLFITAFTDPTATHPIILVAAFLLVYIFLYSVLRAVTGVIPGLASQADKRHKLAAMGIAGILTAMLVLQSIGQLTIRDTVTVMLFSVLLFFYVSKFGRSQK
jgi:hypothetical protein